MDIIVRRLKVSALHPIILRGLLLWYDLIDHRSRCGDRGGRGRRIYLVKSMRGVDMSESWVVF